MKRIVSTLFVVACLMVAMPAQAQLKFGVKGGLNLSSIDVDGGIANFDGGNRTGFFIGPMAEFTLPVVGLGVDGALMFSQKGGDSYKENGLEIPVNLKYSIGLGSLASVFLAAGPSFFFNFSDDKIEGLEIDKKDAQVALNLGAGVKLIKHLQVGVNYNLPLSNTAEIKLADVSFKTKVWQVSLAYIF